MDKKQNIIPIPAIAIVVLCVGLLLVFMFSDQEEIAEIKEQPAATTASASQEEIVNEPLRVTGGVAEQPPAVKATASSSSGGGGSGGSSNQEPAGLLTQSEAECIAQDFICEISACSTTILGSSLEGNVWVIELIDEENNKASIKLDAYTGEII